MSNDNWWRGHSHLPRLLRALLVLTTAATLVTWSPTQAQAAPVTEGKEWRELYETTGLSWDQVATVCPTDGVTPCSGSVGGRNLTGWVWATETQVLDLLDDYAAVSPTNPVVSGIEGFWGAISFLGVMRWTQYTALTYFYSESTSGLTASTTAGGQRVGAGASYSHALAGSTADGSIGIGASNGAASPYQGVFLWRTAGLDYTPPVITPVLTGTLGFGGWYRSDVGVAFTVTDPESAIVSTAGCDPATVATDTASTSFTCTATSAGQGGPASASVSLKRDATPPTLTCPTPPTFELGQPSALVTATVTDTLSGPMQPTASATASTATAGTRTVSITSTDRAGNTTTITCGYTVTAPRCDGKVVTIMGTSGNNTLTGTAGNDVIHGLTGNDTINGGGGKDTICGGDGADVIYGDAGNDWINGGAQDDDLNGGAGDDTIDGGLGNDSIRGDSGPDRCTSGEVRMSSCNTIY